MECETLQRPCVESQVDQQLASGGGSTIGHIDMLVHDVVDDVIGVVAAAWQLLGCMSMFCAIGTGACIGSVAVTGSGD